jgi:hypothetical protein
LPDTRRPVKGFFERLAAVPLAPMSTETQWRLATAFGIVGNVSGRDRVLAALAERVERLFGARFGPPDRAIVRV